MDMRDLRLHVLEGVREELGNVAPEVGGVGHGRVRNGGRVVQRRLDLTTLDERNEAREQHNLVLEAWANVSS